MAYKCLNCGHIFEEGEQKEFRDFLGEYCGRPVYETTSGCPHCGGSYEKTVPCEICGSEHLDEELCGGVCEECFDEHKNDFEVCKKFADDDCDTEFIEINAFLASVFDAADIEQILMDFLRNKMPDVDCRNFINNDKSWFGEKLVKEVSKNENKKG